MRNHNASAKCHVDSSNIWSRLLTVNCTCEPHGGTVVSCFLFCSLPTLTCCRSRLKGPPPALEGPLAVNTRLQKGRRLFTGKLHGPESFTADEEGEQADSSASDSRPLMTSPSLFCKVFYRVCVCVLQVTCTPAQLMESCGESALMTASPSSRRWEMTSPNVVCVFTSYWLVSASVSCVMTTSFLTGFHSDRWTVWKKQIA